MDTRAESAIAAAERGDVERATAAVIDLIAEDWNNAEAHRAWSRVLSAKGLMSDAVAACRTALTLDPRRPDLHFALAEALLAEAEQNPFLPLAHWREARQAVLDGMERSPDTARGAALLDRVEHNRARAIG